MNELHELIDQIMRDAAGATAVDDTAEAARVTQRAYQAMVEAGLSRVGVPERLGGVGGDLAQAVAVVRAAARHPVATPIAEVALVCGQLAADCGRAFPGDTACVVFDPQRPDAFTASRSSAGWAVGGAAVGVPWVTASAAVVLVAATAAGGFVVGTLPTAACVVTAGANLAGEPRDRVAVAPGTPLGEAVTVPAGTFERLRRHAALARAAQVAGALEAVLAMSVTHAGSREQFGRPIARFQAVRHALALMAADVTAAVTAVTAAALRPGPIEVMSAKVETSRAATTVARLAHQVHGAIGTTWEHPLHRYTSRLWAWRDEYGSETYWARRLADHVHSAGDDLWRALTG